MAQPAHHIEIDPKPARLAVKKALRACEDANRELAKLEDAVAAHFGIRIERTQTHGD